MHFDLSVNATRPIAVALLREGKLFAFPPDSRSENRYARSRKDALWLP